MRKSIQIRLISLSVSIIIIAGLIYLYFFSGLFLSKQTNLNRSQCDKYFAKWNLPSIPEGIQGFTASAEFRKMKEIILIQFEAPSPVIDTWLAACRDYRIAVSDENSTDIQTVTVFEQGNTKREIRIDRQSGTISVFSQQSIF